MRYLPPVYSRQSIRTICVAAATIGIGRGDECSQVATAALEEFYPGYRATLLNSGTGALTLALELALSANKANSTDVPVVALPAYACPDVATAVAAVQSRITLFDVDSHTLEPDLASVERCLRLGARVVVIAHLYGRVTDMRQVRAMCDQFGAIVVEDAAQHAGGSVGGVRGGAQADLSVLSFGRGKGLNAGGGGALLLRASSPFVAPTLPPSRGSARALITSVLTELLSSPVLYAVPARVPALGVGETRYHDPESVTAMPHGLAYLLSKALCSEAEEITRRRRMEAKYYRELSSRALPQAAMFSQIEGSGALRTPVALDPAFAGLRRAFLVSMGVVRSYPRTLAEYKEVASRLLPTSNGTPGATFLAAHVHTLPTHAKVRDRDAQAIVTALGGSLQND